MLFRSIDGSILFSLINNFILLFQKFIKVENHVQACCHEYIIISLLSCDTVSVMSYWQTVSGYREVDLVVIMIVEIQTKKFSCYDVTTVLIMWLTNISIAAVSTKRYSIVF